MIKRNLTVLFSVMGLAFLILDTKTAITGMIEGMEICWQTLLPSLFPFILLSTLLTASILGKRIPFLRVFGRLLGMPKGTESIFIVGFLGGYPVGAQCITQAYQNGHISRENAERMLCFCSNAGPAFLFGLGTRLFPSVWYCWVVWLIHIISAMAVGFLTPTVPETADCISESKILSLPNALHSSIRTMSQICGWVVLFRVILSFCQCWFLWMLPQYWQLGFSGLLEIANGCCALSQVTQIEVRVVLFSFFLGFGGLCVAMQTKTVCEELSIQGYLCGKILQAILSLLLSLSVISREMRFSSIVILTFICSAYYFIRRRIQKSVAFSHESVYNVENR